MSQDPKTQDIVDKQAEVESTLDDEERQLMSEIEDGTWVSTGDVKTARARHQQTARNTIPKSERITIRLTKPDLEALRKRAADEGLPYQTLISSVLHKYVTHQLVPVTKKP